MLDLVLDRRRQFRHLQPLQRSRVRAPDAGATGDGEHGHAIAPRQRIGGQDRRNGHRLVEIVANDEAIFREHRVISRRPAGHARSVRGCGPFASAGAADLGHDHGLLHLRGALRGTEKFRDVANALDEQHDDVGLGILHHVVEKFAGTEIALIAGRDDLAHGNAQRLGAVQIGKADPAALRDHSDPLSGRNQRYQARLHVDRRAEGRGDMRPAAEKALGIRARDAHAGPPGKCGDLGLHGGAVAALLGKAGGDDHGILHANIRALLKRREHTARGDHDDRKVDGDGDVGDGFEAGEPVDVVVVRIDGIDVSGEFVLAQHCQEPPRDLLMIPRGADQCDAPRREERVERVGHRWFLLFFLDEFSQRRTIVVPSPRCGRGQLR